MPRKAGTSVWPRPWSKGSCQVMLLYTPQGRTRSLPKSWAAALRKRSFSRIGSTPSTCFRLVAQSPRKFGATIISPSPDWERISAAFAK